MRFVLQNCRAFEAVCPLGTVWIMDTDAVDAAVDDGRDPFGEFTNGFGGQSLREFWTAAGSTPFAEMEV